MRILERCLPKRENWNGRSNAQFYIAVHPHTMGLLSSRKGVILAMPELNPRYLSYCKALGNTPEKQAEIDEKKYPGGRMTGFTLWLQFRWKDFRDEKYPLESMEFIRLYHVEFDQWLAKKVA